MFLRNVGRLSTDYSRRIELVLRSTCDILETYRLSHAEPQFQPSVALSGCETWSLALGAKHRAGVVGMGSWGGEEVPVEEFLNFFSATNITRIIK
jgi:hypothetical protein